MIEPHSGEQKVSRVGISTNKIHLLQFKIQGHLQKRGF